MLSAATSIKGLRLLTLIVISMGVNRAVAKGEPKAAALIRNPSSIVLDGRLDEPEWRDALVLSLVQQSPKHDFSC